MEEEQTPPSSPVICCKPTWQESPLFVLDLIYDKNITQIKELDYEFWQRVYRNIEIFERAIMKCIDLQDMLLLETVVNRLALPDSEVRHRIMSHGQKWPQAQKFLQHLWQ